MAIFGRAYPIGAAVKILRPLNAPTQTLTAALFSDADTFFAPTVTPGAVTLAPSLYSDTDTFFTPVISLYLVPALFDDSVNDTFYTPTITPGAVTLVPPLFNDSDTFYVPTITPGAVTLAPSLFADTDTFYTPQINQVILPGLFSDTDTFYSPTIFIPANLAPSLFVDTDTFFSPRIDQGIFPGLFVDADTFYSSSLVDTQNVKPGLLFDQDTFYQSSILQISFITLTAAFLTDTDLFFSPVVRSIYTLQAPYLVDNDVFYSPAISTGVITIFPGLFVDQDRFFQAQIGIQQSQGNGTGTPVTLPANTKYASQFTITTAGQIFALQVLANGAQTSSSRMMLYADNAGQPGALLAQSAVKTSVVNGANTYAITPYGVTAGQVVWIAFMADHNFSWLVQNKQNGSRYNTDAFSDGPSNPFGNSSVDHKQSATFALFISSAQLNMQPSLFVDTDTFYSPVVTTNNSLVPPYLIDTDFFYGPVEQSVSVEVEGQFIDQDIFYIPVVSRAAWTLTVPLLTDTDTFFVPQLDTFGNITTPVFVDQDVFYDANLLRSGATMFPILLGSDDTFFSPQVRGNNFMAASLFTDTDSIFTPVVTTGSVGMQPPYLVDIDSFYTPAVNVSSTTRNLFPDLFNDLDVFFATGAAPKGFKREQSIIGDFVPESAIGVINVEDTVQFIGGASAAQSIEGDAPNVQYVKGQVLVETIDGNE